MGVFCQGVIFADQFVDFCREKMSWSGGELLIISTLTPCEVLCIDS